MTDQNSLLQNLQQQLAAAQSANNPASAWGGAGSDDELMNTGIPIKVETPIGKVRLQVPAKLLLNSTPQQLMMQINTLLATAASAGYEIDAWQPQQKNGWNNNGGSRGGWSGGGNRGGWNGGGWNGGGNRW